MKCLMSGLIVIACLFAYATDSGAYEYGLPVCDKGYGTILIGSDVGTILNAVQLNTAMEQLDGSTKYEFWISTDLHPEVPLLALQHKVEVISVDNRISRIQIHCTMPETRDALDSVVHGCIRQIDFGKKEFHQLSTFIAEGVHPTLLVTSFKCKDVYTREGGIYECCITRVNLVSSRGSLVWMHTSFPTWLQDPCKTLQYSSWSDQDIDWYLLSGYDEWILTLQ